MSPRVVLLLIPYQYYFRIDNKQFRKSTKTKDEYKARQIALNHFDDIREKKDKGKKLARVSFAQLMQKYLQGLTGQPKYKYHSETSKRHFLPYFKKFDDVSKITEGDLNDYLIHRKGKSSPKNQTLNREHSVLNQLFKLGNKYGWCGILAIPHQSEKWSRHRRRHFTKDEILHLLTTAKKRVDDFKKLQETDKLKINIFWERQLLFHAMVVIFDTGIRVPTQTERRCRCGELLDE